MRNAQAILPNLIKGFILLWLLLSGFFSQAQQSLRIKKILIKSDTTILDSLPIDPTSININGMPCDCSVFGGLLIWTDIQPKDSILIQYRVFQYDFTKSYFHKDIAMIEHPNAVYYNEYNYTPNSHIDNPLNMGTLSKSGSISRGMLFGNNQDLSINNNLNLSLSGKLTDNLQVRASVTDQNIPIQPEGNTQQLQDFDKVFIELYNDKLSLIAGDAWLKKPLGYFMNFDKRIQGATFHTSFIPSSKNPGISDSLLGKTDFNISAAVSKGKYARNTVQGIEGNQGPYKLKGNENEPYIIVLSGTEKVYLDGGLLVRGQANDYVINYNTSELTFTPNVLITKDKRIVVEFQYSDKNYARFLGQSSVVYTKNKRTFYLNIYSETDSKNQPLQQGLSDSDKVILGSVGDSLNLAVNYSIDSVQYNSSRIMYKKIDTLGTVAYVFSTSSDSAFYQLSFSNVGVGYGNYIEGNFTALGRTYIWVAPDTVGTNIILNGSYEPVQILISPKKKQMISVGSDYKFNDNTSANIEVALSNNDINTFSTRDKKDNLGYAVYTGFNSIFPISHKPAPWKLITSLVGEFRHQNFTPIERYRPVEFERDWNISDIDKNIWEGAGNLDIVLKKKGIGQTGYHLNTFLQPDSYTGIKNGFSTDLVSGGTHAIVNASYLTTQSSVENTEFARDKAHISQAFKFFKVGFKNEFENNSFKLPFSDSLLPSSYRFSDWEFYISNPDSFQNKFSVFYKQRTDWFSDSLLLQKSQKAQQYGLKASLISLKNQQLSGMISYRRLDILNTNLSTQKPDNTLLGRIEYQVKLWSGSVFSNTFYEVGSGMEFKKEFIYIEVPAGQGNYTWIDYNNNGIKDLDEFEVAIFKDQATYIKTYIPSGAYIKTYYNQFNQVINIRPLLWSKKQGIRLFLSKFQSQTSLKINRKTNASGFEIAYNPFLSTIADTSLQSLNSSYINTVFFNRSGKISGSYKHVEIRSKILLTDGFDARTTSKNNFGVRWNVSKSITIDAETENGLKIATSDFMQGRNFDIYYYQVNSKFSFQPGSTFRISLLGKYSEKSNRKELGGEVAFISDAGVELRYNRAKKGSLLINFNYINIVYSGLTGTSLSFEMLESLNPGENYTWSVSYQRQLGKNLQLNLNYNSRITKGKSAVYTGGVQLRAFF